MVTTSSLAGWSVPLPFAMTLVARPDAVLIASAGGAATSGGAGTVEGGAVCADAAAAANTKRRTGTMRMRAILPVVSSRAHASVHQAHAQPARRVRRAQPRLLRRYARVRA